MDFPYDRYEKLAGPLIVYYPSGDGVDDAQSKLEQEELAHWIVQTIEKASQRLTQLFERPMPDMEILVVKPEDWSLVPRGDLEEEHAPRPYWTDETSPPTLVVPTDIDPTFGTITREKIAFMLYHELALAFLEGDPRPWPGESPLWADEWQFKFVAIWLSYSLDSQQGTINQDLHEQYADIFEPEPDGKTPVTVRGFDWYEDTPSEDYLCYELLLEQFASDLLARYDVHILPRFLASYRVERDVLLSEDVTSLLAATLGPGGEEWLEELVYF
jgi:hypothetical protein